MTTPEQYREAIKNRKRWDALTLYRSDIGLTAYNQLTKDEQMEVDLLIDMARESL